MNRVLEINEELGYAVVEPGVRWFDLYEAIQAGRHRLMLSCADLGWGSVVGNTLDHGATYLPYGVDMAAACGMEVVLADGTLLRTGMGAMPGNRAWHLVQAWARPDARPAVHAVQLRHRHEDGRLADALSGDLHAASGCGSGADDDVAPSVDTLRAPRLDGTIRMVPQILEHAVASRRY